MKNKNIIILDEYTSSLHNGIGTFLKELIGCLKKLNVNICLIEFNTPQKGFEIKEEENIKRIQFPVFQKGGFLANYKIIDKFLRLYIEDSGNNLFMLNHSPCEKLLETIKLSFPLSKLTFTIHEFSWTNYLLGDEIKLSQLVHPIRKEKKDSPIYSLVNYFKEEQRMYSICDRVICLSEDPFNVLTKIYNIPPDKINMIPNGQEDNILVLSESRKKQVRKKKGISEEEQIILFVGRATIAKGISALLKAFKKVIRKHPYCRLVIAGTIFGPSMVMGLGKDIAAKVSYTGVISKKELTEWYQITDIGVMPSYTEQCSNTGIEMMKHGLPIVSSDGFGIRSMFQHGKNSLVAKIGDRKKEKIFADNLAEALLQLLQSKELRLQIKTNSRKVYELKYRQGKMTKAYDKLLTDLFDKNPVTIINK